MTKWFRENLILITIVLGAWTLAFLLFYRSTPEPLYFEERAQEITNVVKKIFSEADEQDMRLIHLMMSELLRTDSETFLQGLGRHAALALFVSGLIILAVDIHTRRESRKEAERYRQQTKSEVEDYTKGVAENVWKAVSGRLVPNEICREIDEILKCHVLKEECHYTITIGIPYEGLARDLMVVRREVGYFARNLTGMDPTVYPVRSSINNPLPDFPLKFQGRDVTLPSHLKCQVDGKDVVVENYLDPKNKREFSYNVSLPKDGGKNIYLLFDEVCKLSETNVYTTNIPVRDLTIRIVNNASEKVEVKKVRLHHPRETDLIKMQDNFWVFKGGILPGQVFSVSWAPPSSLPVCSSESEAHN